MSMKSILISLAVAATSFAFVADDAEAKKRLGGAKSSGMQRDSSPAQPQSSAAAPSGQPGSAAAAPAQRSAAPAAAPAAPSGMSKWMGPIAGLLAGTALGALLFNSGMGGMIGMLLMALVVGAIVFFVFRMLRSRGGAQANQATPAYAGNGGTGGGGYEAARPAPAAYAPTPAPAERTSGGRIVAPAIGGALTGNISANTVAAAEAAPNYERIPEGFDEAGFVRDAKASFVKLQAANDSRDVSTLRDFLTPALYGELAPDIMARDASTQRVDVVRLDANVLEVVSENAHWIASIRFSGEIREEAGAVPEAFNEVWHLRKPFGGKWLVAGIQQVE